MTTTILILAAMVGLMIILGAGMSVRMMRMEAELERAHTAAHLTLDALTAHLNGHDVEITTTYLAEDGTPLREEPEE